MTLYLDVGVVHIQSYLTRAPSLKGRRGASTMLSDATRAARAALPSGVALNPEAGEIDGVVSVVLDPATSAKRFNELSAALCGPLRRALPAAQLRAALWEGTTYPAARAAPHRAKEVWLPAVPEWPLAKPCDWCRSWPALDVTRTVGGRDEHHCADCTARVPAAGAATDPRRRPGPERDLLAHDVLRGRVVPDEFADLAALGQTHDDTHVATLHADGNGIGEFMRRRGYVAGLAAEITRATWSAVLAMVAAIDPGSGPLPVIPHIVGGDDVLLSVPAHQVWLAATALLTGFGAAFPGPDAPTLSTGIVVHHRDHPLADVVELGGELLRSAKLGVPRRAAVAWQSISHDGVEPAGRPPVALRQLVDLDDALATLAATSGAGRQQLARLCRDRRGGNGAALADHVARLGLGEVVAPFMAPHGIPLKDALGMVRWRTP